MVAFRSYQAFLTFKKVGPLEKVLSNIEKDSFLPLRWLAAVDETSSKGHEHVHILICCHMSYLFTKEHMATLCGTKPYLQPVGDTKADQDSVLAYMQKQSDLILRARTADAAAEVETRAHYVRHHKQVPLVCYMLGGKAFADKYIRDAERALKSRQQAFAIAERKRQLANSTAMSFLE